MGKEIKAFIHPKLSHFYRFEITKTEKKNMYKQVGNRNESDFIQIETDSQWMFVLPSPPIPCPLLLRWGLGDGV